MMKQRTSHLAWASRPSICGGQPLRRFARMLGRDAQATLWRVVALAWLCGVPAIAQTTYQNTLKKIDNPPPLLADYPQWVAPVVEVTRYEAPILVNDDGADLSVRAW